MVLHQEELEWFQRSRARWLHDGDRNTRYYHLKTINRRRKNNIIMLRNGSGDWVDDAGTLQVMANEFYAKLFTEEGAHVPWTKTKFSFPIWNLWRSLLFAARLTNLR